MTIVRRCLLAVLAAVLLAGAGTAATFAHQGYRLYAVRTGSMTPTYLPGDLVVDAPPTARVRSGDVITFRSHGGVAPVTTHRVVHVSGSTVKTKGDANRTPDVSPVPRSAVVGKVIGAVSRGGYVLVFFQQRAGIASVMTLLVSLLLLWGLFFPAPDPRGAVGPAAQPAG